MERASTPQIGMESIILHSAQGEPCGRHGRMS
jgi:hypothetical protein